MRLFFLLALFFLISCESGVIVEPIPSPSSQLISEEIASLPSDYQTNEDAINASSYQTSIDDYPVTLFVFSELDAYLVEQGLSRQAFLESPKLDDFVASNMLAEQSLVDTIVEDDNFTIRMVSGDSFSLTDDALAFVRSAQVIFEYQGQFFTCLKHISTSTPSSATGTFCTTTRPFMPFEW